MSQRCDGCGIESVQGQTFAPQGSDSSRVNVFCSNCEAKTNRKAFERWLLAFFVVGLVGVGLLFAFPDYTFGNLLINLCLLQIFFVSATIPHELGHALVARLNGFPVTKVIIGFGTPILQCQLFGFPFEFRRIPLGGVTVTFPDGKPRWRFRWFMMVLAGPMINFIMAALAWFIFPKDQIIFGFGSSVNPVGMFILANIVVVAENLFPFRTKAAYGVLSSDGLQLVELLFGVDQTHSSGQKLSPLLVWRRFVKGITIAFLSFCSLLCWTVFAFLWFSTNELSVPVFLFLVGLFAAMGGFLIRAVWRVWKTPIARPEQEMTYYVSPEHALSPYAPVITAYQQDLAKIAEWPEGISPPLFCAEIQELALKKANSTIDQRVRDALEKNDRNLSLHITYATVLCELGRLDDAIAQFERMLKLEGLSSGSLTVIKAELLRALVRARKFGEARTACEKFLSETSSAVEKTYILDVLACLTHNDSIPEYLSEADHWSRLALEIAPGFLTLKGTRGGVLADLGRFEEAKPFLEEVYEKSEADNDKGIAAIYLALCAKAEGNLSTARRLAKKAARIYPQPWLLKKIKDAQLE